jgi:hypothetical protein
VPGKGAASAAAGDDKPAPAAPAAAAAVAAAQPTRMADAIQLVRLACPPCSTAGACAAVISIII